MLYDYLVRPFYKWFNYIFTLYYSLWPSVIYSDIRNGKYHIITGYDSHIREKVKYILTEHHMQNIPCHFYKPDVYLSNIREYIDAAETNNLIGICYEDMMVDMCESTRRCVKMKNNINYSDLRVLLGLGCGPLEIMLNDMTMHPI